MFNINPYVINNFLLIGEIKKLYVKKLKWKWKSVLIKEKEF